jgi:hypothetical protein
MAKGRAGGLTLIHPGMSALLCSGHLLYCYTLHSYSQTVLSVWPRVPQGWSVYYIWGHNCILFWHPFKQRIGPARCSLQDRCPSLWEVFSFVNTFCAQRRHFPRCSFQHRCLSLRQPCSFPEHANHLGERARSEGESYSFFPSPFFFFFLLNVTACWGGVSLKTKRIVPVFLIKLISESLAAVTHPLLSLTYPASNLRFDKKTSSRKVIH